MTEKAKDQGPTESDLSVEDVIKKAEEQTFKTGRDRQATVELATLKVLMQIRDELRRK